ncbi:hypothetical protein key_170 [Erwinia phage KEY]|uniref:Uncharacterized protein n=2 Tax=Keyvirus TaxID=3152642 RepID=A0AAE7WBS7_9CAUD|nr:hypothetical protein key_170 [Erwinia phage KEY]
MRRSLIQGNGKMIEFTHAKVYLLDYGNDAITVACLDALTKEYPNKCYVVDGDGLVVRMAEND